MKAKTLEDFLKEAEDHVQYMSCEDYKNAIERDVDHLLLDVRTKEEYDEHHIEGAINVPRGLLEFKIIDLQPNKNAPIMVCCRSGRRAMLAAYTLMQMGYSDVRVLDGGVNEFCKI